MQPEKPTGATLLRELNARRRRRWLFRLWTLLVVGAAGAAVVYWRQAQTAPPPVQYVTAQARLGDLRETVTATGTLKGLDAVDVGAQISGRVASVNVAINDRVKAGDVLAEIAPEQLRSRVEQSRAQVKAADAAVQLAKATLNEAQLELARMRELLGKGLASQRELEASEANATRANASLASTEAQATLARAALRDQQTQLSYTTIRAPFDGIVLSRSVEPGQTVAASLQSPILFTVARDLTKLELLVDVDEADVGRVREGQPATFAVDAWPGRSFESSVQRVHNLPTAGQTVVTYRAVLSVDNSDRSLRPGMTATATITTAHEKSVLLVPNAALRFTPPLPDKPSARPANSLPFMMSPPRLRRNLERSPALQPGEPPSAVWVLEAGQPKRVGVEVGGTDGEWTEVTDQSVSEGQQLVIDIEEPRQP